MCDFKVPLEDHCESDTLDGTIIDLILAEPFKLLKLGIFTKD
jgi:hypothetical protein